MNKSLRGLGPNQRRILGILKSEPNLTLIEIAGRLYDCNVKMGSYRYTSTSRSVADLVERGLIEKHEAAVTFTIAEKKRRKKNA